MIPQTPGRSTTIVFCLPYLHDVAVDSGEAKVLRQVPGAEHGDVERLVVRGVHDPDADFRLQIHRVVQRRGHCLQAVVDEASDLRQRHTRGCPLEVPIMTIAYQRLRRATAQIMPRSPRTGRARQSCPRQLQNSVVSISRRCAPRAHTQRCVWRCSINIPAYETRVLVTTIAQTVDKACLTSHELCGNHARPTM